MSNKMKDLNIAVVMFDGGEEQDIVGCWEMFSWATEYDDLPEDEEVTEANFAYTFNKAGGVGQSQPNLFTVAHTTSPMVMSSGISLWLITPLITHRLPMLLSCPEVKGQGQ